MQGIPLEGEVARAAEGAVAADDDQPVDARLEAGLLAALHALVVAELGAARRIEHCAAAVERVADAAQVHLKHIVGKQPAVAAADAITRMFL